MASQEERLRALVAAVGGRLKALTGRVTALEGTAGGGSRGMVNLPPVGRYLTIAGVTGFGLSRDQPLGTTTFVPVEIPAGGSFDAFRTRIESARSGGTGVLRRWGLFRSNAFGLPLGSGMLASATIDDTRTTGNNGGDFPFAGGALALPAGRYWEASHYSATTAPTSNANIMSISNVTYAIGTDDNNAPDAVARSLFLTGQTDLPTADIADSAWFYNKGNDTPILLLRRSA